MTMNNQLTNDDIETIRIHLNAFKERLCNQRRWKEAEEYQRIIDRFIAFAYAQPDVSDKKVGRWIEEDDAIIHGHCSNCGWISVWQETNVFGMNYCPNCGAMMVNAEE